MLWGSPKRVKTLTAQAGGWLREPNESMSKVAVPPYGSVYTVGRMPHEIKQVFNIAIIFDLTFLVYTELC